MKIATGLLSTLLLVTLGCGAESKKGDSADAQASTDQAQDQADDKAPVDQADDKAPVDQADDKAPVDQADDKAPVDQADDKAPIDQADDKVDQKEPKQEEPKQEEPKQEEPKQDDVVKQDDTKKDDDQASDNAGQQTDAERVQALIDQHGRDGFMTHLEERFVAIETAIAALPEDEAPAFKDKLATGRAALEELRAATEDTLLEKATALVKEIETLELSLTTSRS